jgi:hypothetical protein
LGSYRSRFKLIFLLQHIILILQPNLRLIRRFIRRFPQRTLVKLLEVVCLHKLLFARELLFALFHLGESLLGMLGAEPLLFMF